MPFWPTLHLSQGEKLPTKANDIFIAEGIQLGIKMGHMSFWSLLIPKVISYSLPMISHRMPNIMNQNVSQSILNSTV